MTGGGRITQIQLDPDAFTYLRHILVAEAFARARETGQELIPIAVPGFYQLSDQPLIYKNGQADKTYALYVAYARTQKIDLAVSFAVFDTSTVSERGYPICDCVNIPVFARFGDLLHGLKTANRPFEIAAGGVTKKMSLDQLHALQSDLFIGDMARIIDVEPEHANRILRDIFKNIRGDVSMTYQRVPAATVHAALETTVAPHLDAFQ